MQLTPSDFSELMKAFDGLGDHICVAVSGGVDSLALALLLKDWAPDRKITALSVDHGLRAEAARECQWVKETLCAKGLFHETLCWVGEKPQQSVQSAAREARYKLMSGWCREQGVGDLFVAHHLEDQAETFLMRLARGSSVDGLGAMHPITDRNGIRIVRPLLNIPKETLKGYLIARDQDWIEDPSNHDERFDRVRVRHARAQLEELGLSPFRLSQTAKSMRRAQNVLEKVCVDWLRQWAVVHDEGYILLAKEALGTDEETILRALRRIGQAVGGEIYPPRLERLERLYDKLVKGQDSTLMGCRWIVESKQILVCREIRHTDVPKIIYDIELSGKINDLECRCLGEEGWVEVKKHLPQGGEVAQPYPVLCALVSFWDKEGVCLVPHLGYKRTDVHFDVDLRFNGLETLFHLA